MKDVYLVDDHAMMRDGLRLALEAGGYRVVGESDDPTRALAEIQTRIPAVVLLDLHLGVHSGLGLLSEMQRRQLPARTIVVTMSAQPHHVSEALRLGASGYVLKGAPTADLLAAIEHVLSGGRYLSGPVAELAVRGEVSDEAAMLDLLSVREHQIVLLVVRGRSSAEIGALLHLSPKTVDSYRSRLMAKLGVVDLPALVRFAIRTQLIDVEER